MSYRSSIRAIGFAAIIAGAAQANPDVNPNIDIHDLTVWRHPNQGPTVLTNALADARLGGATNVLDTMDRPGDIACCVVMRRSGSVSVFPDLSGAGGIDFTQAKYNLITNGANTGQPPGDLDDLLDETTCNIKVITSGMNSCNAVGAWFGCAGEPGTTMVLASIGPDDIVTGLDCVWAHEFGHNQGLPHRNDANALMHATAIPVDSVNQAECNAFHGLGGPSGASGHSPPDETIDDACAIATPTVSEWAAIVMTLLLLTAGAVVFGRRRSAAA